MNVFEAVRRVAKPIKVVIQHLPYAPANINPPSSLDFSHRVLKLTCVFFRPNPSHRETPSNHFMHFSTPSYPPIILCLLRFNLDGRFARSLSLFGRGDNIVGFARLAILPELVSPTHNISHISFHFPPSTFFAGVIPSDRCSTLPKRKTSYLHANDGSLFSSDTVGLVKGLSEGTRGDRGVLVPTVWMYDGMDR